MILSNVLALGLGLLAVPNAVNAIAGVPADYTSFQMQSKGSSSNVVDLPWGQGQGTQLIMWGANNGENQRWMYVQDTGSLHNMQNKMCLDVFGFNYSNGANVVVWPCNGYVNQSWRFETINWSPGGRWYFIRATGNPKYCLANLNGSGKGARVGLMECGVNSDTYWSLERYGPVEGWGGGANGNLG
ncbi:hypothetical protein HDU98_011699 [Podochytrium sp. JEL0797]|nr:hypothetical protein HDU98_011699 [Podochytrium sp. JEL0797]